MKVPVGIAGENSQWAINTDANSACHERLSTAKPLLAASYKVIPGRQF